jgi:hypothetical protein
MEAALAKRIIELAKGDVKDDDENDNSLTHLVRHTQGKHKKSFEYTVIG